MKSKKARQILKERDKLVERAEAAEDEWRAANDAAITPGAALERARVQADYSRGIRKGVAEEVENARSRLAWAQELESKDARALDEAREAYLQASEEIQRTKRRHEALLAKVADPRFAIAEEALRKAEEARETHLRNAAEQFVRSQTSGEAVALPPKTVEGLKLLGRVFHPKHVKTADGRTAEQVALSVACPTCRAPAGEACDEAKHREAEAAK